MAVTVLPISAIEDPRFLIWLGQSGVYRMESRDGSFARIGEGRVINRLRTHRSKLIMVPGKVVAVFGLSEEWTFPMRRYLETRLAADWVEEGNALTHRTFNWTVLNDRPDLREQLDRQHEVIRYLLEASERILDNDADEWVEELSDRRSMLPRSEAKPTTIALQHVEVRLCRSRQAPHLRIFPHGSRLRLDDGIIHAEALVRRGDVILQPGSSVYRTLGIQAGRTFERIHRDFLELGQVTDEGATGKTRVAVATDSAAFLLKNVTGGRMHMASRWQLV